ncbi:MAG: endonuclease/exonuclease/phosphatase family protein [Candidatus Pacebacteria bacterium]|nr:endonuclease/exonuclease/phosphatase family protein [Candidatus Paceibacterota bacterium]MCF7857582.1 endonuclease/exonuclease/phosphatase family protein [Candidatus Paceibacterota bacterium]
MKIITLNTWGGRAGKEELLSFLRKNADDTDIFCLQEIWSAPYEHLEGANAGGVEIKHQDIMVYGMQEIHNALPNFSYYFHPHNQDNYGLMMLIRGDMDVSDAGDIFVHKYSGFVPEGDVGHHARNVQYVSLRHEGSKLTVMNFHGLWNGKGKIDSEDRINQSQKIIDFIRTFDGKVILCGDFNLLLDTQSIKMFEDAGLRNLIREYKITSTRSSLYSKSEKFADYIFVSNSVEVRDFQVINTEVSDHLPLSIEIK